VSHVCARQRWGIHWCNWGPGHRQEAGSPEILVAPTMTTEGLLRAATMDFLSLRSAQRVSTHLSGFCIHVIQWGSQGLTLASTLALPGSFGRGAHSALVGLRSLL
jgi:hypothetical protein